MEDDEYSRQYHSSSLSSKWGTVHQWCFVLSSFYWIKLNASAIMSFDVRSEKLALIKGPCTFPTFSKLTSYEEKLAVIFYKKKISGIIALWVLRDPSARLLIHQSTSMHHKLALSILISRMIVWEILISKESQTSICFVNRTLFPLVRLRISCFYKSWRRRLLLILPVPLHTVFCYSVSFSIREGCLFINHCLSFIFAFQFLVVYQISIY